MQGQLAQSFSCQDGRFPIFKHGFDSRWRYQLSLLRGVRTQHPRIKSSILIAVRPTVGPRSKRNSSQVGG